MGEMVDGGLERPHAWEDQTLRTTTSIKRRPRLARSTYAGIAKVIRGRYPRKLIAQLAERVGEALHVPRSVIEKEKTHRRKWLGPGLTTAGRTPCHTTHRGRCVGRFFRNSR